MCVGGGLHHESEHCCMEVGYLPPPFFQCWLCVGWNHWLSHPAQPEDNAENKSLNKKKPKKPTSQTCLEKRSTTVLWVGWRFKSGQCIPPTSASLVNQGLEHINAQEQGLTQFRFPIPKNSQLRVLILRNHASPAPQLCIVLMNTSDSHLIAVLVP